MTLILLFCFGFRQGLTSNSQSSSLSSWRAVITDLFQHAGKQFSLWRPSKKCQSRESLSKTFIAINLKMAIIASSMTWLLFQWIMYMPLCVYVYECMCVCMCVHVHQKWEVRSQCQVFSSIFHPIFFNSVSHRSWSSPLCPVWPVSPRAPPLSVFPVEGLQVCATKTVSFFFNVIVEDLTHTFKLIS